GRRLSESSVLAVEEVIEPVQPFDEILAGHRPERESQAPFAAAAECGPGNGDDVRLVQQTVGERRRVCASCDAGKGEEAAARWRPRQRRNGRETFGDELTPPHELGMKLRRVRPVVSNG